MSSKRSAAPIVLKVGSSRCLRLMALALCTMVVAALLLAAIDWGLRLGLMSLTLLLTWQEWLRRPEFNGRGGTLTLSSDGAWRWEDRQRRLTLPLPHSYARSGHFVALHFKLGRGLIRRRSFDLLLCTDAVDPDGLRRLRLQLNAISRGE